MWLADQIQELFEEALSELDRLMRLELERVGPEILRWLDDLWARMPCDTCVEEFDRIVANLARDQLFVEEDSRQAFIAWLNEANEAAKRWAAGQFKAGRANNRQSGGPTIRPVEVALADMHDSPAPNDHDPTRGGAEDDASGLRWIPFERHMENDGVLLYKTVDATGAHW